MLVKVKSHHVHVSYHAGPFSLFLYRVNLRTLKSQEKERSALAPNLDVLIQKSVSIFNDLNVSSLEESGYIKTHENMQFSNGNNGTRSSGKACR